jgi:REP element-mobilizing transposase RayT
LSRAHPAHITCKVRRDVPSLRSGRLVRELERSFRAACERGRFRVVHYSVQRDHVHLLVEAATPYDLACGMKSIGARIARAVNRVFARVEPVFADRFHAHVLRTPAEVRNAIAYVLLNTRRHLAKLGRHLDPRASIDAASSGRWFEGWVRNREPAPPRDPPAVARARSWLLSTGWRRRGLVDPAEVPGGSEKCGRIRRDPGQARRPRGE